MRDRRLSAPPQREARERVRFRGPLANSYPAAIAIGLLGRASLQEPDIDTWLAGDGPGPLLRAHRRGRAPRGAGLSYAA
jgi:hypothetical protein